jgi:hypothetical protein
VFFFISLAAPVPKATRGKEIRVGRQYIFNTKTPSLSKFWSVLQKNAGKFYGHSVHFKAIWYILWSFWYIFPVLVCCTKKNLATLNDIIVPASRTYIGSWLECCRKLEFQGKHSNAAVYSSLGMQFVSVVIEKWGHCRTNYSFENFCVGKVVLRLFT